MGAKQSQYIDNINTIISQNTLNSLQSIMNNISSSQTIYGKCDIDAIKILSSGYKDCIIQNYPVFLENKDFYKDPINSVRTACSVITDTCRMDNINISSTLNITNNYIDSVVNKQTVYNNIKSSLTQYSGTNSDQQINIISKEISDNIATISSNLSANTNLKQSIILNNIKADVISLNFKRNSNKLSL